MGHLTAVQELVWKGVSQQAYERQVFAGLEDGGMNACVACCDRWADGYAVGLTSIAADGAQTDHTFRSLQSNAARFANLLTARGIRPGDVVAGLLPRGVEMLTVILGTWRAGAIYQPIFTGFGPSAIAARINHTGRAAAKLIVTDAANRSKLEATTFCPPVLVVTDGSPVDLGDGDLKAELARQSAFFTPVSLGGDAPFILLTGGCGGTMRPISPKLRSLLAIQSSVQIGLHPREEETGWDVADPAWFFNLYFSVLRPLLLGESATAHDSDRGSVPLGPVPAVQPEAGRWIGSYQVGALRLVA